MVYIATLVERDTTSTSKVKKIDTNPLMIVQMDLFLKTIAETDTRIN